MIKRTLAAWVAAVMVLLPCAAIAGQSSGTGRAGGAAQKPPAPAAPSGVRARGAAPSTTPALPAGAGPVVVVETVKGSIEFATFPTEAPKSVEHILALVRRNFYNGQRVHRVVPGFVVQFGDPLTRDVRKRADWGTGGSGKAVGVGEMNAKRPHILGAVALAHAGNPAQADSQMYITMAPQPQLNKNFTVFGQVVTGMPIVRQLQEGDIIRRVYVKGEKK